MIKIAFVIDTIESPTAGTEKQLLLLIRNLDRTKFEPYLCVLRTSKWLKTEFSECKLVDIGFLSFKDLASWLHLIKFSFLLRKERINIVQTYFKDGNKVGILAGKLGGIQAIVATRRNQGYWHTQKELFELHLLNLLVTNFLANSQSTKKWVKKTERVNDEKISVIYNAMECEHFYRGTEEQKRSFRKKWNFPSDSILIGLVANLRPVKSIDLFIKAAKTVTQRYPQSGFVIVGEGPERRALEQLCQSMQLGGSVCFLGERFDIPDILSCLDIGVLASSSESFSNAIIEYMAAGLPVICTDVGGACEAVEDGVNGFIVEPGNYEQMAARIVTLIEKDLSTTMGQNGREKAKQWFSLKEIIVQHQRFYETIL